MRRITPSEVLEAFKRIGRKPIQGKWSIRDGGRCGQTAIGIINGYPQEQILWRLARSGFSYIYLESFMVGWDENRTPGALFDGNGYSDGRAAYALCVAELA